MSRKFILSKDGIKTLRLLEELGNSNDFSVSEEMTEAYLEEVGYDIGMELKTVKELINFLIGKGILIGKWFGMKEIKMLSIDELLKLDNDKLVEEFDKTTKNYIKMNNSGRKEIKEIDFIIRQLQKKQEEYYKT